MTQPGALVISETAHEAARFSVRTAVFMQAWQGLEQWFDVRVAETAGRPFLEFAELENVADNPEMGENVWANVNVGADNFHRCSPVWPYSGEAWRDSISNRPPEIRMCSLTSIKLTGSPRRALSMEE